MGKANFEKEVLDAHNEYRKLHNTVPVKWSKELAKNAQAWADHLAKEGRFEHAKPNQRKGQGENIAYTQGRVLTGDCATKMWYDEVKDYDFTETPRHNPKCGHFTQVIWNDTTEIGAGIAAKDGKNFVVVRYSPPGNMLSKFPENIKPPVSLIDNASHNAPKNIENNVKKDLSKQFDNTTKDLIDGVAVDENQKNIDATSTKMHTDTDINVQGDANVEVTRTGKNYHVNISFGQNMSDDKESKEVNDTEKEEKSVEVDTKTETTEHQNNNNNETSIKSKIFNFLTYRMKKYENKENTGPKLVCQTIEVTSNHMPVKKKENKNKYLEFGKSYEIVHYVY